jgi:CRP-like cAMP-binding protein
MCDPDLRSYILGRLPFFKGLAVSDIAEINKQFIDRGYQSGEIIFFEGDPATRLYVVADGNVKLMHHTPDGKAVMLDILTVGDFFGRLTYAQGDVYFETAHAHTPVCCLSIDGDQFRQILKRHPPVALKVMDIMAKRLREANKMVQLLSVSSVEQRLAHVLVKLADKFGQQDDVGLLIQMPLSRADLAEMTGTTTETASRVMSHLGNEGLVQTGRQWVAITEKTKLAALSAI